MNDQGLKQPKVLPVLFLAELVQKFSFWGMQALLVILLMGHFSFSDKNFSAFIAISTSWQAV